jgi:hypothetical protein
VVRLEAVEIERVKPLETDGAVFRLWVGQI